MIDTVYCECCGEHPATIVWQKMRICESCEKGFNNELYGPLGMKVEEALGYNALGKLQAWAAGCDGMWGGELSQFLDEVAGAIKGMRK